MKIIPLELKELNRLVILYHRHHKSVQGHRFSIGCYDEKINKIVGGCSVGRPVSRLINPKEVLEITRLVVDGTKNACSMLYSAAARIGREMGYKKIQTYILETETGHSLKCSGWICENKSCGGRQWIYKKGKTRRTDQPICKKQRWIKELK